jgi:hypothetical protein
MYVFEKNGITTMKVIVIALWLFTINYKSSEISPIFALPRHAEHREG